MNNKWTLLKLRGMDWFLPTTQEIQAPSHTAELDSKSKCVSSESLCFFWHLFRRILVLVTSATWTPGKLVFENDHEHDVRGIIIWTYLNNHLQPHFLKNVRQQLDYPFSISLASWHFSSTVIMQPVLASTVASYHLLTYTLWYLDIAMDNIG